MIPMPKLEGATLFDEGDLQWGLTLRQHAVALMFSRPLRKLVLDKKQAVFLAKGLRWLAGGATLYAGDESLNPDGGNDPGHIELGCKVDRTGSSVVLDFGSKVETWAWTPSAAEYAAGRIAVETRALP